ncbi:MAG: S-adenosylmethionine:tRNA ribosyltransferase-isomerase [Polyangiales bacterium]
MTRLLVVDTADGTLEERDVGALPALLDARDLLVVNDAATLPASLSATFAGEPVEVRLVEGPHRATTRAVLLGRGDHRTPTEHRPPPPRVRAGDVLRIGSAALTVAEVSTLSPRLVTLAWEGDQDARFALVYRAGRPVQYSHAPLPRALWDVQTMFASRPWAVEMPSAARPLDFALLSTLLKKGIAVARVTEAAGLSSTGDPAIDDALPLPERYEIPPATVRAIDATRARGGRVVAVGTSVVRALEDSAGRHGRVVAGAAMATLVLSPSTKPRVVAGLLTGIHVPGESHYQLLGAFAEDEMLTRATAVARERGLRPHELGDAALLLPGVLATRRAA